MCHDLLAESLPTISKDPRNTSVHFCLLAFSPGSWKQWDYQHHWITSCVTNSNNKNMSADDFLNPGSVPPHSCSTLIILEGCSIVSVLFGFIFVSVTCSSMKKDWQIFAAPSQFLCYFKSTLCTCALGRLHIPLCPGCAWLSDLMDLPWQKLQP